MNKLLLTFILFLIASQALAQCYEGYLPNYYDLQYGKHLYTYGDFLYWFAKEDNLSACMTVKGSNTAFPSSPGNFVTAPVSINHLDTKWDPGLRVGLGYNFTRDGWDLVTNYTWYQNNKGHVFSVPSFGLSPSVPFFPNNGERALVDPWLNVAVYDPSAGPFLFDKVNSRWKLHFNQIDLDLGRKFWLSCYSSMRIYAGVRGAYFTTRFHNISSSRSLSPTYTLNKFSDQFKDRAWGVGIIGGIQPEWHFLQNFILFANIDAALLWGRQSGRKKEDYTSFSSSGLQTINYHSICRSSLYKMLTVLDLSLGLRWEETWCNRMRTSLDLSWENHLWFDEGNRFKTSGSFSTTSGSTTIVGFQSYEEEETNLMMGGPVLRFRVDF